MERNAVRADEYDAAAGSWREMPASIYPCGARGGLFQSSDMILTCAGVQVQYVERAEAAQRSQGGWMPAAAKNW